MGRHFWRFSLGMEGSAQETLPDVCFQFTFQQAD